MSHMLATVVQLSGLSSEAVRVALKLPLCATKDGWHILNIND